jgi:hypothetical protein
MRLATKTGIIVAGVIAGVFIVFLELGMSQYLNST